MKKKILYSIGTFTAVATPIVAVVSCGSTQKTVEHKDEDETTQDRVTFDRTPEPRETDETEEIQRPFEVYTGQDADQGPENPSVDEVIPPTTHATPLLYQSSDTVQTRAFSWNEYRNEEILPITRAIVKNMQFFKDYDFGTTETRYDKVALMSDFNKYMFGSLWRLTDDDMWDDHSFIWRATMVTGSSSNIGRNIFNINTLNKAVRDSLDGEEEATIKQLLTEGNANNYLQFFKVLSANANVLGIEGLVSLLNKIVELTERELFVTLASTRSIGIVDTWEDVVASNLASSGNSYMTRAINEYQKVIFSEQNYKYEVGHDVRNTGYDSYDDFVRGVNSFTSLDQMISLLRKVSDSDITRVVSIITRSASTLSQAESIKTQIDRFIVLDNQPEEVIDYANAKAAMYDAFYNHYTTQVPNTYDEPYDWIEDAFVENGYISIGDYYRMFYFDDVDFNDFTSSHEYDDLYAFILSSQTIGNAYFGHQFRSRFLQMHYEDLKQMLINYDSFIREKIYDSISQYASRTLSINVPSNLIGKPAVDYVIAHISTSSSSYRRIKLQLLRIVEEIDWDSFDSIR